MHGNGNTSNHHLEHMPEVGEYTPQEANREILDYFLNPGRGYRRLVVASGALLAVGIIAFIVQAFRHGFDDRAPWAYYAAAFAFLLTTAGSAPLVSITMRMAKSHWRRGLSRASEMFAVSGLFMLLMYIPLLFLLPVTDGRTTLWVNWHGHAPHIYDTIAILLLVTTGLALLYVSARPDFATLRDNTTGGRQRLYARLALGWQGTKQEWHRQRAFLGVLGAFYFMFLIFTHLLISTDFAMSLVPGWKDSIYPAYHALTGLQSAIAITIVGMFLLRRSGLRRYLYLDHFWALAKLMLALSLLWFYFWWSGFFIFWYGRSISEQGVLNYLMKDTYFWPFIITFLCSFIIPVFFFLIWNPIRKSVNGPAIAASVILVGAMFARIREYVAGFSIPEELIGHEAIETTLPANAPYLLDVLFILGALGGVVFFYLLGMRFIPVVSIWEHRELALLRKVRPYLRRYTVVLGKPE